jgi:LytR cell envelope-related transcriptional attenuator
MGRHSVGEDRSFLRSLVFFVLKWTGLALIPLLLLRGVWGLVTPNAEPKPTRAETASPRTPAGEPTTAPPATSPSPQPSAAATGPAPVIQVLNGTDKVGQGTSVAASLRRSGRQVIAEAQARKPYAKTTVLFQPGFEQAAKDLAATLGGAQVQAVPADVRINKNIPLTVIVGADYKPPAAAPATGSPAPSAKPSATPSGTSGTSGNPPAAPSVTPSATSATVQVQVLNGTDVQGLARRAADKLQAKGYGIQAVKNAVNMYDHTIVYYQPGFQRNASEVVGTLGTGTVKPAPANLQKDVPLTVVVGKDYS